MHRYVGLDGVYTHTVAYERDPACQICSPSVPFEVASTDTLQQVTPLARAEGARPSMRCAVHVPPPLREVAPSQCSLARFIFR